MASKHRISKVTTRAGDKGQTKLATGRTIGKHDALVRVIGSVDELNSHIGVLDACLPIAADDGSGHNQSAAIDPSILNDIQQALFDMGAVFAMEGAYDAPDASTLEIHTNTLNDQLPPLTEFVLPRGGPAAAQSHVCRTVCRRAETDLWTVIDIATDAPPNYVAAAQYLNRLSDFFFVLARCLTLNSEEQWQGPAQS